MPPKMSNFLNPLQFAYKDALVEISFFQTVVFL